MNRWTGLSVFVNWAWEYGLAEIEANRPHVAKICTIRPGNISKCIQCTSEQILIPNSVGVRFVSSLD